MQQPGTSKQPIRTQQAKETGRASRRPAEAGGVAALVAAHAEEIVERWRSGRLSRIATRDPQLDELLARFLTTVVSMIPAALDSRRDAVSSLWASAAELYGSVAAMRGLAAGEVVEEFQQLREVLVRTLYRELARAGVPQISLRELLELNRLIDRGVAQASVGYTDALYFSWLRGTGIPEVPTPEIREEIRRQLGTLEEELRALGNAGDT